MRRLGIALCATVALCALVGCGGSGADVTGPTLTGLSATPNNLPIEGGSVLLSVTAQDTGGVTGVLFRIVTPSGTVDRTANSQGSGLYTLSYAVGANTGMAARTYSVTAVATDGAGNTATSSSTSFTVEAATGPPPPPSV